MHSNFPYQEVSQVIGNNCAKLSLVLRGLNEAADFYRSVMVYGLYAQMLNSGYRDEIIEKYKKVRKELLFTYYQMVTDNGRIVDFAGVDIDKDEIKKEYDEFLKDADSISQEQFYQAMRVYEILKMTRIGMKNLTYNAIDLLDVVERHEDQENILMPLYKYVTVQKQCHSFLNSWRLQPVTVKAPQAPVLTKTLFYKDDVDYYKAKKRLDSILSAISRISSLMAEMNDFLTTVVVNPVEKERIRLFAAKQQAEIDAQPKTQIYTVTVGLGEHVDFHSHVDALACEYVDDLSDRLFEIFRVLTDEESISYLSYCKGIINLDIVFEFYQASNGKIVYSLYPDKELEEKMTKEDYERLLKTCKKAALDSLPILSKELNKEKTE